MGALEFHTFPWQEKKEYVNLNFYPLFADF